MQGGAGFLPSVVCDIGILGATLGISGWVSCFHSNAHNFGVCFKTFKMFRFHTNPRSREFASLVATSQMVGIILSEGHNHFMHMLEDVLIIIRHQFH